MMIVDEADGEEEVSAKDYVSFIGIETDPAASFTVRAFKTYAQDV